jgi:hypothetical protein
MSKRTKQFATSTQTDERDLRYPLINNLRLAHKPRGISWLEINAAWSQAAQLLMFVGSTIKFKSKDLRIVNRNTHDNLLQLLNYQPKFRLK